MKIYKSLRLTNLDQNLSKNEKLIYNHLILCLDTEKGFAYPSYPELMLVLGVKRRNAISEAIEGLREKGYIETQKGYRGANNYYLLKHITSNETDTSNEIDTSNETDTSTSNETDTPLVTKPLLNKLNDKLNDKLNIYSRVVTRLNELASKKFSPKTKTTIGIINARLKEGYVEEDFYKVIDIKTKEWINDPMMNKFLRPETLFGNKFESYLNQEQELKDQFNDKPKGKVIPLSAFGLEEDVVNE